MKLRYFLFYDWLFVCCFIDTGTHSHFVAIIQTELLSSKFC